MSTAATQWEGKTLIAVGMLKLAFCAYLYFVWMERNTRFHSERADASSVILNQVKQIAGDGIKRIFINNWELKEDMLS